MLLYHATYKVRIASINCFEYSGVIPPKLLGVWDESGIVPLLHTKRIRGRDA